MALRVKAGGGGSRNWFPLQGVRSSNGRICSASYVTLACQECPIQERRDEGSNGSNHRQSLRTQVSIHHHGSPGSSVPTGCVSNSFVIIIPEALASPRPSTCPDTASCHLPPMSPSLLTTHGGIDKSRVITLYTDDLFSSVFCGFCPECPHLDPKPFCHLSPLVPIIPIHH